jgi:hypothetical protein
LKKAQQNKIKSIDKNFFFPPPHEKSNPKLIFERMVVVDKQLKMCPKIMA